jgi:hypothetical protein
LINDKHHKERFTIGLPEFVNKTKAKDTDEWALVTDTFLVQFDLTAHHATQNSTPGNGMNKSRFIKSFLLGLLFALFSIITLFSPIIL